MDNQESTAEKWVEGMSGGVRKYFIRRKTLKTIMIN